VAGHQLAASIGEAIIYHFLTRRQPYQELGIAYFDRRDRQRVEQRLVRRLVRRAIPSASKPRSV